MNKKVLLLAEFIILLCSVSTVFSKGTLLDHDAFETYFGKSKNQVKLIAPALEEMDNGAYYIDNAIVGGSIIVLVVAFDDNDIVNAVGTWFYSNALDYLKLDNNYFGALKLGTTLLGVDNTNMVIIDANDKQATGVTPDGAYCSSQNFQMIENQYAVACLYAEVLDQRKNNASSTGNTNYSDTINTEDSITSDNSQLQENVPELDADLKSMPNDELSRLYSQIVNEMTSRNILHAHFNPGEYIAGRDMRPGIYTVSVIKNYDTDSHSVKVCYLDEKSEIENHWLINQHLYFKNVGEKGSFSIESNELLEIYGCELEIIDYRPFLQ